MARENGESEAGKGYGPRDLQAFEEGRNDVEANIAQLERRLEDPRFADQREDYQAKLAQLQKLRKGKGN